MSSVVLDAEYVDSGEDESEESAVELWSPSASDSDRASVYLSNLPSPQTLDSLCRRGRKELTSGERQMKWALNCFTEWCHSEGLTIQFEDISAAELNDILKKFYSNARRKDGMEFSKPGFTNIRLMIDRYFKTNLQRFPIIRNADFEESNKVFETKIARLTVSGQNSWRRPCSISPKDIEKLLSCGVFSAENPFNLLLACWFNITLHFDCGDHLKQRKLSKFQFLFKTNSSGVQYVKFASSPEVREQLLKSTSQEDESSLVMYSVPSHPLCPVKLLRKYLQKLHPEFDSLYQCPVPYSVDDRVPIWYEKRPIGIHQLEAMMGTISKDAELSRAYSNACLKATSPLMYLSCGFNTQSQSDQQSRLHRDVAITDVSSTPSNTLLSPRSPATDGKMSKQSNPSAFSSSSLSNQGNNASHLPEGESFVNSCFQPTLEETYEDNSDVKPSDLGHPSASNVLCKIDSVCGGFDGEFIAGFAKASAPGCCQLVYPAGHPTVDVPALAGNPTVIDCGKTYLRFQVTEGKLFLEPDINGADTASQGEKLFASTITIHVHFMHQRLQSKPVSCAYELAFKEDFYLEFENIKSVDVGALLSIPDKIHLVLITTDADGRTSLVSSHRLDWQRVLASEDGKLASSVELNGVGAEAKMMVGVLEINMTIVPKVAKAIAPGELRSCVSLSQCRVSERDRQFMSYARHWWKELISSGPPHCRHSVKIFAQDECGSSHPVVSYVRPLHAGWLLDTPIQAAEFVSLLAFEEEASMWGGRTEMWNSLHVFLSRRKGGCEDHATLLCSLLLGFGLNAYVCCGTTAKDTPHVWVMTRQQNGVLSFWESLSAQRFNVASNTSSLEAHFKTIGCVFDHTSFYANIQSSDLVSSCSFDFNNPCHWKAMSEEKIQAFCGEDISPPLPRFPPLLAPTVYPWIASQKMEEKVKEVITHHRKSLGLPTKWENNISYLLAPALSSSSGDLTADVKEAVDRVVPPGYSFSARVHSFKHRNARHAVEDMLKLPDTESIIVGVDVTLALRVRVVLYPENTCVARVVIASLWHPNNGPVKFEWED